MININFVGDIKIDNVKALTISNGLKQLFRQSDLNVLNFEAPLMKAGSKAITKSGPCICQDQGVPRYFVSNSFGLFNLANNHSSDYGVESLMFTKGVIEQEGAAAIGVGDRQCAYDIYKKNIKGKVFGFIAGTQHEFGTLDDTNQHLAGAAWLFHPRIIQNVIEARKTCDYVIVLSHAGLENQYYPLPEVRSFCRMLIDAGADCVIGSHPHTVQSWEYYKDKPIVYSLGNFAFDASWGNAKYWNYGAICSLSFEEGNVNCNIIPTHYKPGESIEEVKNEDNFISHLTHINEVFKDEGAYQEAIDESVSQLRLSYRYLFERSGYFKYNPVLFFRMGLFGIIRKLLGKSPHTYSDSHILNNLQCEVHRWAICRLFQKNF